MHIRRNGKPVAVETPAQWNGRPLILCIEGPIVKVREKGRHTWFLWPIERIYLDAVRAEVAAQKKARKAVRAARREASRGLLAI